MCDENQTIDNKIILPCMTGALSIQCIRLKVFIKHHIFNDDKYYCLFFVF